MNEMSPLSTSSTKSTAPITMDVSIPEDLMMPCASQPRLKRPKKANAVKTAKTPSKRKKIGNDGVVDEVAEDEEAEETLIFQLSAETKATLLKLRKIEDPFDKELQKVIADTLKHFKQQKGGEVDLAEAALLVSGITNVVLKQIKTTQEFVYAMADRLSNSANPPANNKKKQCQGGENERKEVPDKNDERNAALEREFAENSRKEIAMINNADISPGNAEISPFGMEVPIEAIFSEANETAHSQESSETGNEEDLNTNKTGENLSAEENGKTDEPGPELTMTEALNLEKQILEEIPGRCTRRQSDRLKNILSLEKIKARDYTLKKRKYDEDPPDLVSCHDEWNAMLANIEDSVDIDMDEPLPPVLDLMVRRKKIKLVINNNEEDADCKPCQSSGGDGQQGPKVEVEGRKDIKDINGTSYQTLDHIPVDEQETFHTLIQEMHNFSFHHDFMNQDVSNAYQQKFGQAVGLLSQNHVLVKRSEEELKDSQISETDKIGSSITNLIAQFKTQLENDFKNNKEKQLKPEAEVPISQTIANLKRAICGLYKKWHVRADGDKVVYQRIQEFKDKVKSVLKKEEEQGLFDVRKYEMDIMDATLKESQENEMDEFLCPLSPILPLAGMESPQPETSTALAMYSPSRRSSINGSIDGANWIPIDGIFSQMKLENSEACRHFYAMLELLSQKNLTLNYDTLPSQRSAKLITKLSNKNKTGDAFKHPVGAKIMASRCPDIDQDEVYLAPSFTTESILRALEQDSSSSGYQSDSQASGSTSGAGYFQMQTIEDKLKEFVADPD